MPRTNESGIPDTHFIWTRDELVALLEERALMKAELDALREALQVIAYEEPPDETWDLNVASSGVEWAGKIARAVLERYP